MGYPSLEQYQTALQHPEHVFTDPELKHGQIKVTGLGMPLVQCGGFALTYSVNVNTKRYAVRCFHKESKKLEDRYAAITKQLKQLTSPYFVDFEFLPRAARIDGENYPIVKMAWATGETLGEFLETHHKKKVTLATLQQALRDLGKFLERAAIAHGDIQTGNVMVSGGGARLQLIDYDGMYVDAIKPLGSAELGHRNFQHPDRARLRPFDATLDRFSLITLTLALKALEEEPALWDTTHSDSDGIVFRANDFMAPEASPLFLELSKRPSLSNHMRDFAAICKAPLDSVPSLEAFLARQDTPRTSIVIQPSLPPSPQLYLAAYPVLDATDYSGCLRYVGDRVELIGQIAEVKESRTRHGKPYVFINFGPWRGQIVKISIWSEGLDVLSKKPEENWIGQWISIVGLMEPPYHSKRLKYSHLAITITQNNQMTIISKDEAQFRFTGSQEAAPISTSSSNVEILERISAQQASQPDQHTGTTQTPRVQLPQGPIKPSQSANQQVMDKIRQLSGQQPAASSVPQRPISMSQTAHTTQGSPNYQGLKQASQTAHTTQGSPNYQRPKQAKSLFKRIWDFFAG